MPTPIVAPKTRVSVDVNFSKKEIRILDFMIQNVLKGARDCEIQRTVSRKPEWAALCAKIQKARESTLNDQG